MAKTPTKSEILAKAVQLWKEDRFKKGQPYELNPEIEELKEEGFTNQAQSELMRDSASHEVSEWKGYIQQIENVENLDKNEGLPLDIAECQKSNLLVSGCNQQGKSLTAIQICNILINHDWQCVIFDNSGVWKYKSNIQTYNVSEEISDYLLSTSESAIFDISLLTSELQKSFVETVLRNIWNVRIKLQLSTWLLLVFEEFQLYAKNIRGSLSQNLLRIMTVGANQKLRCLGITCDLALIDPSFIRLCQQRYHFKLGNEPNANRRFKSYYGEDWLKEALRLDVGECVYVNKDKLSLAKIPLFKKAEPNNEPCFKFELKVNA